MGVNAVPDHFAYHSANRSPFLLQRYFLDTVPENGQKLPQQVKLQITEGMLGGQSLQLLNPFAQVITVS